MGEPLALGVGAARALGVGLWEGLVEAVEVGQGVPEVQALGVREGWGLGLPEWVAELQVEIVMLGEALGEALREEEKVRVPQAVAEAEWQLVWLILPQVEAETEGH